MLEINQFTGLYRFLSNFYPTVIPYEGKTYHTVEHAYQAAKTLDQEKREIIRCAPTPGYAKRLGKLVELRPDWDEVKLVVMLELLMIKFSKEEFRNMLIATGDAQLIEGNTWGDVYWGVCHGRGENHLGRLLMQVREEIKR